MPRSKTSSSSSSRKPTPKKSRARTEPFAEYPEWSQARFFSFIRSALRSAWSRWPPKYKLLAAAKRKYTGSNKRLKWEFLCNECQTYHPQKSVSVDHVEPAGSLRSFEDLGPFCSRLFVGEDKLQVLCKSCHQEKSNRERIENNKEKQSNA